MLTIPKHATVVAAFALLAALAFLCAVPAYAQNAQSNTFTASTQFSIPAYNAAVSFAGEGNYQTATLSNDAWNFAGISSDLSGGTGLPGMGNCNFSVAAKNSNITITSLHVMNGFPPENGWLNYTVAGEGSQAFNMYYGNNGGMVIYWSVYVDGVRRSQNDSYSYSADGWLNVTDATRSVSIYRENVNPVQVKVDEFRAQGMNDTQIVAELAKLNMWWDPKTGACALGTRTDANGSAIPTPPFAGLPIPTPSTLASDQHASSTTPSPNPVPWSPPATVFSPVKGDVRLSMSLEKTEFTVGEQMTLTFAFTNVGSQPVNFNCVDSNGTANFQVYNSSGAMVYSWFFGAYPLNNFNRTLAPSENITQGYIWGQDSLGLGHLPSGNYYIVGDTGGEVVYRTDPLNITIRTAFSTPTPPTPSIPEFPAWITIPIVLAVVPAVLWKGRHR